jgi:hypothetical protein
VVDQIEGCVGFVNNSQAVQPDEAKQDKTKAVNYANLKTQCYFKFAQLAEEGVIGINEPADTEIKRLLIEELEQVKQKNIDKDSKISLVDKDVVRENIGRSPDIADAFMFRMYFEIAKRPVPRIITL